jgi:excinuclease UvrABC ATPase subunit
MERIRVWKELDVEDIDKHLFIIDDLHGHCNSCKKTGIALEGVSKCPECGNDFKYIAARIKPASPNANTIYKRMFNKHSDKLIIDYDDYKHLSDRKKASGLFNGI